MSLFRKAIPGLYDGVSQQSATLRTPLQCEKQVNAWATIADGLGKRPPSEHLGKVADIAFSDATIHHINRDTSERYVVVATDGDLKVFNYESGAELTVNFPEGKAYLDVDDASEDFGLVTVADYTFVVNRKIKVQTETVGASINYSNFRWINRQFGSEGSVFPGAVFQYQFSSTAGENFRGERQRFEDLPDTASNGDIYKITGSSENAFAAFYVKRVGAVWEEHRKVGMTDNRIDPRTMPHALVREADGTFSFAPFSWAERRVGDEDSNPAPTFVNREIRDVFFVQNRLGFLIDENTVLSCAGDFGNFWRNTVTTVVASDTVDVAVTGAQVSVLYHALPFNDTVMLFSDQNQFVLTWGEEGISPDNVAITPVTAYRLNLKAKPVQLGRDIYFCANSSSFSRVYEYYNRPSGDGAQTEAADITSHVPRYVPEDVFALAAAPTNEALFLISALEPRRIYVYKFAWADGQSKAQSNWGYWDFPTAQRILSATVLDSYVYVLVQYADGVYLERINLRSNIDAPTLDRPIHLDRLVTVIGTYDNQTDRTQFTLPYAFSPGDIRVIQGGSMQTPEALLDPSQYTFPLANTVSVPGNFSGTGLAGVPYVLEYEFSAQFATTDSGAILSGRTILRSMTVRYTDSAYFKTSVSPYGDDPLVESVVPEKLAEFTGKTLGEDSFILNSPAYGTGDYSFQVYGEAETARVSLINDSHVASTFQSAEAEITYHNRAR